MQKTTIQLTKIMETITKYRANNGSEWADKAKAEERDALCFTVDEIMKPLGDIPQAVTDGKGWLQHNLETVLCAKDAILDVCRAKGFNKTFPAFNNKDRDCHAMSIIGRVLMDHDGPLSVAWNRFCKIDDKGREHQQPYFAYTKGPLLEHIRVEVRK